MLSSTTVRALSKEVSKRLSRNAAKQTGSLPGQVLGFLGPAPRSAAGPLLSKHAVIRTTSITGGRVPLVQTKKRGFQITSSLNLDLSPAVLGILGAHVVTFALWSTAGNTPLGRDAMTLNFTVSFVGIQKGYYHSLLASAISSQNFLALLFNGITIYFIGSSLRHALTTRALLGLYFGASVVSGLTHLAVANYPWVTGQASFVERVSQKFKKYTTSHASNYSLLGYFAAVWPMYTIYFFGMIPMPAIGLVAVVFLLDVLQGTTTTTLPNLAGLATGATLGLYSARRGGFGGGGGGGLAAMLKKMRIPDNLASTIKNAANSGASKQGGASSGSGSAPAKKWARWR